MPVDISYLQEKRQALDDVKKPWEYPYEVLGKYIFTRKQLFASPTQDAAFLNDGMINDSTAVRANAAMASAIMGALWKSGGKTFRIRPAKGIPDSGVNKKYYMRVNQEIARAMESPKAGFEPAFHEFLCEEGAFGTSSVVLFQGDYNNPLMFKCWGIQCLRIAEGPDGYVDTVYYDESITLANLVARYGEDSLPEEHRKRYAEQKNWNERVKICVGIEPRKNADRKGGGNLGMPIASYHFIVEGSGGILKESGFTEMPARVGRWYKLPNEVYGRSPGMDALPAIMQLNAFKESFLVGVEKKVDPPLYVLDDGALGASVVDTSARGLSVFNTTGRVPGQPPIGQMFDIGELQSVAVAITETKEEILQHFLIDRLYDLNNKSRMTLGEAEMRYQIRSDALSSIYARHTAEILYPLITRAFNILFDMGILGIREEDEVKGKVLEANGIEPMIIPSDVVDAIDNGRDIYEIDYISPAAHVMREEEYRGLMSTVQNALTLAPVSPDAMDPIDIDAVMKCSAELSGAPPEILRAKGDIDSIRQARADAQAKQMQAMLAEQQSKAVKNVAGAAQSVASIGAEGAA